MKPCNACGLAEGTLVRVAYDHSQSARWFDGRVMRLRRHEDHEYIRYMRLGDGTHDPPYQMHTVWVSFQHAVSGNEVTPLDWELSE